MAGIRFSGTATASAATSITLPLGGTPSVGDLVLAWVGVDNEIPVRQPGYGTIATQWVHGVGNRAQDSSTLNFFYHTWNASDSGSSVTFQLSPILSAGLGDKGDPSANAVAVAVVLTGPTTCMLEQNTQQASSDYPYFSLQASPLKKASALAFHAGYANGTTASLSDSDGLSSVVTSVTNPSGSGQALSVFSSASSPAQYKPTLSFPSGQLGMMVAAATVSDSTTQSYNPPYIDEGPVNWDSPLLSRYRLSRNYTVLNNSGVFTAVRYESQSDRDNATQVFVDNSNATPTDRTNILNSGVGGDFLASS